MGAEWLLPCFWAPMESFMLNNCSGLTLFSDRSPGSLPREQLCVICFLPSPGLGKVAAHQSRDPWELPWSGCWVSGLSTDLVSCLPSLVTIEKRLFVLLFRPLKIIDYIFGRAFFLFIYFFILDLVNVR